MIARKFWNVDGGSPEADLTQMIPPECDPNCNDPECPYIHQWTVADAETGDRSATAETSPAICRPDLSEADAKRLTIFAVETKVRPAAMFRGIDRTGTDATEYNTVTIREDRLASIIEELLDAATAKIAELTAERNGYGDACQYLESRIAALTAERDAALAQAMCDHHWIGGNDGLFCTICKLEKPCTPTVVLRGGR